MALSGAFLGSDFGPESDRIRHEKTSELSDSPRFLCFTKRPMGDKSRFVRIRSDAISGAGGLIPNDISSAVSIRYKTCFILCNELVTVFYINLAAPQQCLTQALPLRSACFVLLATAVKFIKSQMFTGFVVRCPGLFTEHSSL